MEVERVFSIHLVNAAGVSAFYWVERHHDGFHLMNWELGHCDGPFTSAVDALTCEGTDFSGETIEITSNLPPLEFAKILAAIDCENAHLKVNGEEVQADFDAVMDLYNAQTASQQNSPPLVD